MAACASEQSPNHVVSLNFKPRNFKLRRDRFLGAQDAVSEGVIQREAETAKSGSG
jgi:hypothetical protein